MRRFLFILSAFMMPLVLFGQNVQLIHAGHLLANPGKGVLKKQTIVIKGSEIVALHQGYKTAEELGYESASVLDMKQQFVMPGFIDMHTHITSERDPQRNPHEWTTLEREDFAFRAIPYLERTLMAGFTTVRNLGADASLITAVRRAVSERSVAGPRIIASMGAISATGGHGDFHGYREEIMHAFDDNEGICDGSDDCRRAVRARVQQGADVIKITATGGVLSNTAAGVGQQFTDEELKAIVETATSLGRKVAAHAHAAGGINAALRAGVSSIEHGSYLDEESVKLFQETGAYLVPTLLAGVYLVEEMEVNDKIPPAIVAKIKQVVPVVEASFKRALKGKVNIAFGTDSGVSKHGINAREFELMVKYGMDAEEAIKSATVNAAKLLGMEKQLGAIAPNMKADLVAVEGNPLEDISLLKNIKFVMKEGVVYKQ